MTREVLQVRQEIQWKSKTKKGDDSDRFRLMHEYLPTTRLISASDLITARRTAGTLSDEAGIDRMMEAQLQEQWLKYFSPLQKRLQDAQQKGIAKILSTVLSPEGSAGDTDLPPEVAFSLAKSFLASHASLKMPSSRPAFIERYKQNKSLAAVVNEIATIEKEIEALKRPRDELQRLLNKLFLNKTVDLSDGNIKVTFNPDEEKQKSLKLSQLSSGEKQALFILIHALRADLNSLIIDEPELSMHIDWQRQLVSAISALNPATQIVMATHSPEIMANVPDNCIFEI